MQKVKLTYKRKKWVAARKDVVLRGRKLSYNVSLQIRYAKKIRGLVDLMARTTKDEIVRFYSSKVAKQFYAEDDTKKSKQKSKELLQAAIAAKTITPGVKKLTKALTGRFNQLFKRNAPIYAKEMVTSASESSATMLAMSLKQLTGGVTLNTDVLTGELKQILDASIQENVKLIRSIGEQYLGNVEKSLFRSITSGAGIKELITDLEKYEGISKRHARNVALDQTRKVYNSLNKHRLVGLGVKKFEWLHSGGGQKPRESHIKIDGQIFTFENLESEQGKLGVPKEDQGIPGFPINCFVGSTQISLANGCINLWRYFHEGEIISIGVQANSVFDCTPNHPILTLRGWLCANEIQEGDYLACGESDNAGIVNNEKAGFKTTFQDLFTSLSLSQTPEIRDSSEFNFHGDIPKNDVDTIVIDNILSNRIETPEHEQIEKFVFALSYIIRNCGVLCFDSEIVNSCFSSGSRQSDPLVKTEISHTNEISFTTSSQNNSIFVKQSGNTTTTNSVDLREFKNTFSVSVSRDDIGRLRVDELQMLSGGQEVVKSLFKCEDNAPTTDIVDFGKLFNGHAGIKRFLRVNQKSVRIFKGHVYTLESFKGWYTVTSAEVISKNCRCTMNPVIEFEE